MTRLKVLSFVLLLFPLSDYECLGQEAKLLTLFPVSSPEQQGIRSATLDSLMRFIQNSHQNIHQLIIIRNNHTILEADFYPYSSKYMHDVASVTKSITSLLIGIAIDKGFIQHEAEKVLKFFPEIVNPTKGLDSLRVQDLLTMTSGFACGVADGEKALGEMRKTADWIKFIFDLPMLSKPGDRFSYCSCNFYLLGEILFRTTGLTPHAFAKTYLFGPLDISNSKWLSTYKNINHGWGDLFLMPADMAKIGKLLLDQGRWQNQQIVSKQWINKSIQTFSKLAEDKGYGYGWWTNEKVGYYEAAGRGRQTISILPSKNMIVTMLGGEFDAATVGKYILQSIESDKALKENKADLDKLIKSVKQAALPPAQPLLSVQESVLNKVKGRTIVFEKNITGIDSISFNFSSKTAGTVIFYKQDSKEAYPFILSTNIYAMSMDPTIQLPVALQASCKNENELILHYNQLCRINNFYFHFKFDKETITTTMEETSNLIKTTIVSSFNF